MSNQGPRATRKEVLAAIARCRPWGRDITLADLYVQTSQPYSVGEHRVAVILLRDVGDRKIGTMLWPRPCDQSKDKTAKKASNYELLRWIEYPNSRNEIRLPGLPDDEEGDVQRGAAQWKAESLGLACFRERMKWRGLDEADRLIGKLAHLEEMWRKRLGLL